MKKLLLALLPVVLASPVHAASSNFYVNSSNGDVGIGTTSPSNILSLDGTAARTIWMERGSAAGNTMTVQSGGGVSAGSNENGSNLILTPGITTGTGTSNIQFQSYPAGS